MPAIKPPLQPAAASASDESGSDEIAAHERRNLLVLGVHHIVLRLAWIFKTESVIVPAFVDTIAGAAWVRSCLPVLNRLGQSVPPMMFSETLRSMPRKKWALVGTSVLMAAPFLVLAGIWRLMSNARPSWLPWLFLVLYAIFFAVTGLNQLSYGTLQGKLVRAQRRGRLLGISGIVGSLVSVVAGWILLRAWLNHANGGFDYIFAFAGTGFAISGLIALALCEPADHSRGIAARVRTPLRDAWQVFRDDRRFRRAAIVAMLFITMQWLFPHFQALGRIGVAPENLGDQMMLWVVAQNGAVGVFSLWSGAVADARGNRLALRFQVFASAITPPLALGLAHGTLPGGPAYFWVAFCLLGLTPVTMKTLVNYTLELAPPDDHPRYVSTMSLCMAVPFLFSPLAGLMIDMLDGFAAIFWLVSLLVALAGVLTFRMSEPRESAGEALPEFDDSSTVTTIESLGE